MKKLIFSKAWLLMLPALLFAACQFEDDDYFDESASLRVEHANEQIRQLLVKPEHGWVMQYFTGTGVAHFEGFNLFARFEASGKVTLASNHRLLRGGNAGKFTEHASLYSLLLEDGPVLAFNTWNDVLTPFVDPVDPWRAPGALIKDGAGMQGDNNFVVTRYTDGEILLRGERYGAEVRLVACDRPWEEYIEAADKMKSTITNTLVTAYYVTNGTDTLYLTGLRNGRMRYSERLLDPLKADSLAAVFTPAGFRLERTTALGSNEFHEFTLAADSTCLQSEDQQTRIIPCWDSYIVNRTTLWTFDESRYTAEQQTIIEQINQEVLKFNNGWSLAAIGMGKTNNKNAVTGLVFTFYTNTRKSATNTAGLALATSRPAYGQMAISVADKPAVDGNMDNLVNRGAKEMTTLARQFAATLAGTYAITPDNYFLPTGAEFTSVSGGTSFKLN